MNHHYLIGTRIELNGDAGIIKYSGPLVHKINNNKINP